MRFFRGLVGRLSLLFLISSVGANEYSQACGEHDLELSASGNLTWSEVSKVNLRMVLPFGVGKLDIEGVICVGSDREKTSEILMATYRDSFGVKKLLPIENLKEGIELVTRDDLPPSTHFAVREGVLVSLKADSIIVDRLEEKTSFKFRIRFLTNLLKGFSSRDHREIYIFSDKYHYKDSFISYYKSKENIFNSIDFFFEDNSLYQMRFGADEENFVVVKSEDLSKVDSIL